MNQDKVAQRLAKLANGRELRTNRDFVIFFADVTAETLEEVLDQHASGEPGLETPRDVAAHVLSSVLVLLDIIDAANLASPPPALLLTLDCVRMAVKEGKTVRDVIAEIEAEKPIGDIDEPAHVEGSKEPAT